MMTLTQLVARFNDPRATPLLAGTPQHVLTLAP